MKRKLLVFLLVIFVGVWVSQAATYTSEQKNAYNYAYTQWITTVAPIDKANMNGPLIRIAMAKMISNFAVNILWLQPDTSKNCWFLDVSDSLDAQYGYWATQACQLWLMWIWSNWKKSDNFYPYSTVTRAQFATAFSRALSKANGDVVQEKDPYYKWHLEYLNKKWIINSVVSPSQNSFERRWNVMIMMYRASKDIRNYEKEDLIWWFDKDFQKEDIEKINESEQIVYHRVNNSYKQFKMDDFNAVEDVYKDIKSGDRVIFLVRHSERITDCTSEWWLTEHGIELAEWIWKKLRWAPFADTSTDFYWSSTVKRTVQTSYYVGKSRGSKALKEKLDDEARNEYEYVNHSSDIDSIVYGNYFSDGNWYSCIEHLYEENKEVISERALYAINKLCEMTDWHPFSWITSHDWYTLPITEWATNESLTFSQSKSQWPNFMQWVAIIVHKNGWWEIYPVMSLDRGKMNTSENPSC